VLARKRCHALARLTRPGSRAPRGRGCGRSAEAMLAAPKGGARGTLRESLADERSERPRKGVWRSRKVCCLPDMSAGGPKRTGAQRREGPRLGLVRPRRGPRRQQTRGRSLLVFLRSPRAGRQHRGRGRGGVFGSLLDAAARVARRVGPPSRSRRRIMVVPSPRNITQELHASDRQSGRGRQARLCPKLSADDGLATASFLGDRSGGGAPAAFSAKAAAATTAAATVTTAPPATSRGFLRQSRCRCHSSWFVDSHPSPPPAATAARGLTRPPALPRRPSPSLSPPTRPGALPPPSPPSPPSPRGGDRPWTALTDSKPPPTPPGAPTLWSRSWWGRTPPPTAPPPPPPLLPPPTAPRPMPPVPRPVASWSPSASS